MLKIHILGGSGSGKTTLAESLSVRFDIPHYELDKLGWKHGSNMAAYIEDAFAIAEQPGWVTEGSYLIWTEPLFYQADYIVALEVSWPVAAWRIIRRHIIKSMRGINPYPGFNGIRLLFKLLKDNRRHYLNKVAPHSPQAEFMRWYIEEYREYREPPAAELLLECLERYGVSFPPTAEFVHKYLEKYKKKVIVVRNNADRDRLLAMLAEKVL
jgi:GTPase SAR1 family protein